MLQHFPVLKTLKSRLQGLAGLSLLLAALCAVVGVLSARFIPDPVAVECLVLGAALLLIFWWMAVSWRIRNRQVRELREFLSSNQMVPYHFPPVGLLPPWEVSPLKDRLWRAAAGEFRNLREEAQRSAKTLEKYVGTSVTEKASQKAVRSELGGELRRVYVLFSDLRGFTHMTEELRPQETVDILNLIFAAMAEVLIQNGGDINKFIGDAIFAYFRRPYGDEKRAAGMVLRTALRMQERFEILGKGFRSGYSHPVKIGLGIGVTAGEAVVGNLGSANRMEFTLIGDTVNMASRLCGIAEHGQILVNGTMAEAAGDLFELRPLEPVRIKGKAEPQTPYAVMGERLSLGR
jgi:class 3 adenylate cyclase